MADLLGRAGQPDLQDLSALVCEGSTEAAALNLDEPQIGPRAIRNKATARNAGGGRCLMTEKAIVLDKIDLSLIDANTLAGGNQAFHWIGANAFSGTGAASAGELRVYQSGSYWWAAGDTNGDGTADLVIALTPQGAVLPGQAPERCRRCAGRSPRRSWWEAASP